MTSASRKWPLWGLSFLLVLGLHVGIALWALFWRPKPPPLVLPPAAPVMLAQLEPMPPPPPPTPTPVTQVEAEVPPEPKLAEAPKAVLAVAKPKPEPPKKVVQKKPEPKKVEPKKPELPKPPKEIVAKTPAPSVEASKFASDSTSKSTSNSQSSTASNATGTGNGATTGGAKGGASAAAIAQAKASWQGLLLARLAQYKKYPEAAKRFEEVGKRINRLRFVVDAKGKVLSYELVSLSGNALLDQATLDMIRKAQPLPPPPPELLNSSGTLEIIAPLVYELKDPE